MSGPDAGRWIGRVAEIALGRFDDVIQILGLLGGKRQGKEYVVRNPRRPDKSIGSFSICTSTGEWGDFAIGEKGRDLVSLAAYMWDADQGEAGRQLAGHLGIEVPSRRDRDPAVSGRSSTGKRPAAHVQPKHEATPPANANSAGVIVMPVPADAPPAPATHPKLGAPSVTWTYRDASGQVLFQVCRFNFANGKKEIRPLSLRRLPSGQLGWRWLGSESPRPLYGLDRLAARPNDPVMICEGEKAADAAAQLFPYYVTVTSSNGALAADKADWSSLAGRRCVLFPDADRAGEEYAAEVVRRLREAGAAGVLRLNTALFHELPDGTRRGALPEGWDAADALAEGFTADLVRARTDGRNDLVGPFETPAAKTSAVSAEAPAEQRQTFLLDDRGVWFNAVDKGGAPLPPRWVCAPLEVMALVRDVQGKGWSKLVSFADPDGAEHREIIPDALLCGEGADLERLLRSAGLQIAPRARGLVLDYLITRRPKQRARLASCTGWHEAAGKRVFVLPQRAIGDAEETWIYADSTAAADYRERSTLDDWRREIAALCVGNSRMVFAVSLAFAAPLVDLIGGESGGIHYFGESGDGKTTALRVASSVYGGPEYLRQWRSSDNSLEFLAQQHNDCLLAIDELAQVNAKILMETVYMLGNSSGKNRSRAQGGLRETIKWRILFLSSGEIGMAAHVASVGMSTTAGMEGRMAEIPARVSDDPPGIYEHLHGEATPKALSQRLVLASRKHHGTAFPAFLTELVKHEPSEVRDELMKLRKLFAERWVTEKAGNQVLRVADRCALVGAAGELASRWGITGWAKGEAMKQAGVCFKAWLDNRGGEGNSEERAMLAQVRGFLERHGEARFADWRRTAATDTHAPRVINRAGWRKLIDRGTGRLVDPPEFGNHVSEDTVTQYMILPQVFREEVAKGFNPKSVAKLLAAHGCIKTEADGRPDPKFQPPGESPQRMYCILPAIFDLEL